MAPRLNVSQVVTELSRVGRRQRAPRHDFQVRHRPWDIQPFMLAPVLPGETLKSALIQARAVSDPIKNPLVGWWLEHHLYYVKLTDIEDAGIEDRGFFRNFLINPSATLAGGNMIADPWSVTYSSETGYDFGAACLRCVQQSYFVDDGEGAAHGPEGISARIFAPGRENWMQSIMRDTSEADPDLLSGASPDDPFVASGYQEFYDRMVEMGATELTYEDWLRAFGIKGEVVAKPGRPELIRYVRSYQYPSSHVDAASGSVNSVVSWAVDERVSKARSFREPGFIIGVTLTRPKVYLSHQTFAAASMMDTPLSWLPATLRDKPELSLRKFAAGEGPISGSTVGYWIDIRDLFFYGDQFVNFDLAATDGNLVAVPPLDMTGEKMQWYPDDAMIEGLFASTAATGTHAGRQLKQDGAVSLHILSAERDNT